MTLLEQNGDNVNYLIIPMEIHIQIMNMDHCWANIGNVGGKIYEKN